MKKLLAILVLSLSFTTGALADPTPQVFLNNSTVYVSGQTLYNYCFPYVGDDCYGFIEGVADLANATRAINVCIPPGVRLSTLVGDVKEYLIANNTALNYSGFSDVLTALTQAYPCH